MTGEWIRMVVFLLVMAAAAYGAWRLDRDVLEPALTRRGARFLGITVEEYRARRHDLVAAPWHRIRRALRR